MAEGDRHIYIYIEREREGERTRSTPSDQHVGSRRPPVGVCCGRRDAHPPPRDHTTPRYLVPVRSGPVRSVHHTSFSFLFRCADDKLGRRIKSKHPCWLVPSTCTRCLPPSTQVRGILETDVFPSCRVPSPLDLSFLAVNLCPSLCLSVSICRRKVLVVGREGMNRSIHGDTVAVTLLPRRRCGAVRCGAAVVGRRHRCHM